MLTRGHVLIAGLDYIGDDEYAMIADRLGLHLMMSLTSNGSQLMNMALIFTVSWEGTCLWPILGGD